MRAESSQRRAGARLIIVGVVALVLVWRVLVLGFEALMPDGGSASALLREAVSTDDPELVQAVLEDRAPATVWRERFARNPTDALTLLKLALELERQNKRAEATDALQEALRLNPAHGRVLIEAANFHIRNRENLQALALLRRAVDLYPQLGEAVFPVFVAHLKSTPSSEFFLAAARDNTGWWPAFFRRACEASVDARTLQKLYAVRAERALVTDAERICIISRASG